MTDALDRVALGCEQLGGTDWGDVDGQAAIDAVRRAWDLGVRWFDTADVYGLGLSETRLREALGAARHEAGILTKFGVRWRPSAEGRAVTWRDADPAYLHVALEASLRRLGLERIPLYLVHWPADDMSLDDTVAALEEERTAGRIACYGVSNHRGDLLERALGDGADVVELPLSLVDGSAADSMRSAAAAGADVWAYGVLAQGLLSGRYDRRSAFPETDRRSRLPHFTDSAWRRNAGVVEAVTALAERCGATPAQVALRWVLARAYVTRAIVGVRSPEQVDDIVSGLSVTLPADELDVLPDPEEAL